jgi:hypothetical protein
MTEASRKRERKPLSRTAARNYMLINQFATPGLGSLLGRRFVAGAGQLGLAVLGFVLVCAWFGLMMWNTYRQFNDNAEPVSYAAVGLAGAAAFFISWCWAWVTSVSLMREATRAAQPPVLPPL